MTTTITRLNNQQITELLSNIANALNISEAAFLAAESSYESITKWLNRPASTVADLALKIYPQGSFNVGTVNRPATGNEEYDLDGVLVMNYQKIKITQYELKRRIGEEIKLYAKSHGMINPVEERNRCWTLVYGENTKFHLDILPAIPEDTKYKYYLIDKGVPERMADKAVSITDRKHHNYHKYSDDWPRSNPQGYLEWFKESQRSRRHIIMRDADVENLPNYNRKSPLQQAIQILKRHRDIMYADTPELKPISIIITTLATHAYSGEADVLETLQNIVHKMPNYIEWAQDKARIKNPVNPDENFADKWESNDKLQQTFNVWIEQVQADIEAMQQRTSVFDAAEYLKGILGSREVNQAIKAFTSDSKVITVLKSTPSLFNVIHRLSPKWLMYPNIEKVQITATLTRNGFRSRSIQSDEPAIPKGCLLRFEANTSISTPYQVYWQVVNTGYQAKFDKSLRGDFYESNLTRGGNIHTENTKYTGQHWIQCFIVKEGLCMAKSDEFVVKIA